MFDDGQFWDISHVTMAADYKIKISVHELFNKFENSPYFVQGPKFKNGFSQNIKFN